LDDENVQLEEVDTRKAEEDADPRGRRRLYV